MLMREKLVVLSSLEIKRGKKKARWQQRHTVRSKHEQESKLEKKKRERQIERFV